VCPYNEQLLAEFPCATAGDVEQAVNRAWQTFENCELDLKSRLQRIMKLRSLIAKDADEIARLISKEVGKPLSEAYSAEITGVLDTCVWLSKTAPELLGPTRIKLSNPLARSKECYLNYEPLGVIGIISPWNFPFSIPMSSILAAVAVGNTVVLKPSEKSSLTALKIQQLFEAAGFPAGTLNVVLGDRETGRHLSSSRLSRLILTGSVRAGQNVVQQTASNLTPVTLELGGKDAAIVLPDAPVEFTARGLVWGAFTNAGQACASIERVYVVRGPQTEALISAVVRNARALMVGSPEEKQVDIGPMIDEQQLEKVSAQVSEAVGMGAKVLLGGARLERRPGYFYPPTVLTNVHHGMHLMREETFGPVLPIMVVDSVAEAVRLANDSDFGLTASIWSADARKAATIAPKLRVGTVYVNDCIFSHAAPQLPWGGLKQSGIGRSHSHIGLMDMVNIKNTNIDTAKGSGRLWWYPYGEGAIKLMQGGVQLLHGASPVARLSGLAGFVTGWARGNKKPKPGQKK
jgi:succinate-semialdehyde dehydrogenase/glutarate-semialdehyde dehydrogenase